MNKRIAIWLGIVGAALVIIGVVMLTSTVSAVGATGTLTCGTASSPDSSQAYHEGLVHEFTLTEASTRPSQSYGRLNMAACDEAISGRKTWSWVVLGLGAAVLLGAGLAGFRPTRSLATATEARP